jgi:iron complex transport system ATP-binding protein
MTLDVAGLDFDYGRLPALRGVEAWAPPGAVTAILGPNAAGKSTLLRCVIGAARPSRGHVAVDGRPAHRLPARHLARRLAYVAQRATVSARFSVREVVDLGRFALPPDPARVERVMDELGLGPLAHRPFVELSVGQQQRVALARALAQLEPDGHLVLDEPTAGLDLAHVRLAAQLVRERARAGATVLIATHDLMLASALAERVWLLLEGRLTFAGPAAEGLTPERLQRAFGVPFQMVQGADGPILLPSVT